MPTTYNVPDISCDHCVAAITAVVRPLDGVDSVAVAVDAKTVVVSGTFEDDAVRTAIGDAGYDIA